MMGCRSSCIHYWPLRPAVKTRVPDTGFGPTAEAAMNVLPITETLQHVAPGDTRTMLMEYSLHGKEVIRRGYAGVPGQPRRTPAIWYR